MKKALLVLFVLGGWSIQAQSLEVVKYNDTIWMPAHSVPFQDPEGYATIKNTSSNSLDVWCKRQELSISIAQLNYFCWKDCYTPTVTVSPDPITISSNTSDSSFVGYSRPKGDGVIGCDSIRYVFWDGANPNDSAYFTMYYCTGAQISVDEYSAPHAFEAFPNPAKDVLYVQHTFRNVKNAKITITNMVGARVYEGEVDSSSDLTQVSLSHLKSGVYFYSIRADGKNLGTKRFVIAR